MGVFQLNKLRTLASLTLLVSGFCASAAQSYSEHCYGGPLLRSWQGTADQYHLYKELAKGAQSSDAVFEYWRHGKQQWSIIAKRSCSNGISMCWLNLPFKVEGVPFDQGLEVGINTFKYDAKTRFWVFSHLEEQTRSLYFKTMVNRNVQLISAVEQNTYEPSGVEIVLPNIFVEVLCDDY